MYFKNYLKVAVLVAPMSFKVIKLDVFSFAKNSEMYISFQTNNLDDPRPY